MLGTPLLLQLLLSIFHYHLKGYYLNSSPGPILRIEKLGYLDLAANHEQILLLRNASKTNRVMLAYVDVARCPRLGKPTCNGVRPDTVLANIGEFVSGFSLWLQLRSTSSSQDLFRYVARKERMRRQPSLHDPVVNGSAFQT